MSGMILSIIDTIFYLITSRDIKLVHPKFLVLNCTTRLILKCNIRINHKVQYKCSSSSFVCCVTFVIAGEAGSLGFLDRIVWSEYIISSPIDPVRLSPEWTFLDEVWICRRGLELFFAPVVRRNTPLFDTSRAGHDMTNPPTFRNAQGFRTSFHGGKRFLDSNQ